MNNKEKSLGMNPSTANSKLKKIIIFNLIQKLNLDICYRCGFKILNIDELTVDHKESWLHKENAQELFFNFDNIAFSHSKCNSSATSKKKYYTDIEKKKAKNHRNKEWRLKNKEKHSKQRKEKYQRNKT